MGRDRRRAGPGRVALHHVLRCRLHRHPHGTLPRQANHIRCLRAMISNRHAADPDEVRPIAGPPLWTPTVLGTLIFRHGEGLASPETVAVSPELVFLFTWVHLLAFILVGGAAAVLIAAAERNPNLGFGLIILGTFFVFGSI